MKQLDVILSIIGGALVVAVSLTMAIGSIVRYMAPSPYPPYSSPPIYEDPGGDYSPLESGEPATPFAVAPEACPETCFTVDTLHLADLPLAAYYAIGLDPDGDADLGDPPTTAAAEHATNLEMWDDTGNMADECFFTWPLSPIVEPVDAVGLPADPVAILHGGGINDANIERRGRVFPDTESAIAYMATLDAVLDGCHRYTDASSYPTDVVLREPAIAVPDTVAAVGWVRKMTTNDRYYVMDLQRTNVVIRTVGYNNGVYTDAQFRDFMEESATVLAEAQLP